MSDNIDINEVYAEIYAIINKKNGKVYIGQAAITVSVRNLKWGAHGRWLSHIREAMGEGKDHCVILNQAIRKYGVDGFEVKILCEATKDNVDELEMKYIEEYNSMVPNGYNLKSGGANGKDSDETRTKKSESRKGLKHTDETKVSIRFGQRGSRRNKEDINLPDFICAVRSKGVVTGYMVNKFYTNIDLSTHITLRFKTLNEAIEELKYLKCVHSDVWELYEDFKKNRKVKAPITTTNKTTTKKTTKITTETTETAETADIIELTETIEKIALT